MKKFLCLLLTSIFCANIFAADIKNIRFATEATYPPFEFVDESGQIQGFDIDLAKALCQQMKAQCTFTNQSFNSLIPSLKLGKFDAIIATLSMTPERMKQVSFTNSYYEPSVSFVAPVNKHYVLANVPGKIVGAQLGSTMEKYLQEKYAGKITIKTYASIQEAFLDLVSGRVDLVLADTAVAHAWLIDNNDKQFGVVETPIVDHQYLGSGYGIAVDHKNSDLLNALNAALADIKKNGMYEKLVHKYFGK